MSGCTVTLSFDLNDFDDRAEYEMHNQARRLTLLVWNFVHYDLRGMYKYDRMPDSVNFSAIEEIGFEGKPEEFVPSKLSGQQMLELIQLIFTQELEKERINLEVLP